MTAAVVIPARYASTRFPGKVLARDPRGKSVLEHVHDAALAARGVERVIVATDDERIRKAVEDFGGEARMTSGAHCCGSDRCAEVAAGLTEDVVVNVQADEPGLPPELIDRTIALLDEAPECAMSTLAVRIAGQGELEDPNVVKVVVDESWRAMYFSRSPIPYVRDSRSPAEESPVPHLRHLGIYGFRRPFLLEYARLGEHPLERAEKLEQLRALAHGYMIKVGLARYEAHKVDTPEDFEAFVAAMKRRGAGGERG